MKCSTDIVDGIIQWSHDNSFATKDACVSTDTSRYTVSEDDPQRDCFLTGLGSSDVGNQGPYSCNDISAGSSAEAVAILIRM